MQGEQTMVDIITTIREEKMKKVYEYVPISFSFFCNLKDMFGGIFIVA